MSIRTDLISEIKSEKPRNLSGIETSEEQLSDVNISTVKIVTDLASKHIGKPKGTYCTISFPRLDFVCDSESIITATLKSLKNIIPQSFKSALVVGLGNADITPDALGPLVCNRVLATRHINHKLRHDLGLEKLKSVSVIAPNVLGKTGIESYDLITAANTKIRPDFVLVVDALACRESERLCRTIQIGNTGITGGSGVNNARKPLNQDTIGVPVIAIGVPTVIDANSFFESSENMMVTPKEIDLLMDKASDIISHAINLFLQPEIDRETIENLT